MPTSLPTRAEVLYVPPLPDGARRACGNCHHYAAAETRCTILRPDLSIHPLQVCGYWLAGPPGDSKPLPPIPERFVGLVDASRTGGTSCDCCKAYQADGTCAALLEDNKHPQVQARGCCGRWTERKESPLRVMQRIR